MKRRHVVTGTVAAVAAATGAGWAWWHARSPAPLSAEVRALWAATFNQPAGGTLRLSAWRGQPLLVNFWATWCPPCVKEMPLLDAFHRQQQAQGWHVLGLAVDGPVPVKEFLAKAPVSFPIGLAGMEGVQLSRSLGNVQGGLPFTAVLGPQGDVAFRKSGPITQEDLSDWVKALA